MLRQGFGKPIVHTNDLLSNFHKVLGHFGKALAWPGKERSDDLTLYAVILHADARALKLVGRLRLAAGSDGGRARDHCLMIDVRVILVQLCRQALGLFLLKALGPGSGISR